MNENPYLMRPGYRKYIVKGRKIYRPTLSIGNKFAMTHQAFERASEAMVYAQRMIECWKRQYDTLHFKTLHQN